MSQPDVEKGVKAANTFQTVAQNYQSGLGCASAIVIVPIALIGKSLGLPGWIILVITLGVLFLALGTIVFTAFRDTQKAHQEYMDKMANRRNR